MMNNHFLSEYKMQQSKTIIIILFICMAISFSLLNLYTSLNGVMINEREERLTLKESSLAGTKLSVDKWVYPHDDPSHPWNWSRKGTPDSALSKKKDCDGQTYEELYDHFHEYGYVIFRSCTLKDDVLEPLAEYTKSIKETRVQDARVKSVFDLTVDEGILEIMEYIHSGRRLFPFQTLNFPIGTQQSIHSDLAHFDTFPRSLMSAAWTALEDMNENNGPLRFFPKSHYYGTWDPDEVGLRFDISDEVMKNGDKFTMHYGEKLEKVLLDLGLEPKTASDMKRGQTLIWAAGLAHGGSEQKDKSLSRLSQVTHYFFEGAQSYWSPRYSRLSVNRIDYRNLTPCFYNEKIPRDTFSCAKLMIEEWTKMYTAAIEAEAGTSVEEKIEK